MSGQFPAVFVVAIWMFLTRLADIYQLNLWEQNQIFFLQDVWKIWMFEAQQQIALTLNLRASLQLCNKTDFFDQTCIFGTRTGYFQPEHHIFSPKAGMNPNQSTSTAPSQIFTLLTHVDE